jgi:hypothetical protein
MLVVQISSFYSFIEISDRLMWLYIALSRSVTVYYETMLYMLWTISWSGQHQLVSVVDILSSVGPIVVSLSFSGILALLIFPLGPPSASGHYDQAILKSLKSSLLIIHLYTFPHPGMILKSRGVYTGGVPHCIMGAILYYIRRGAWVRASFLPVFRVSVS